MAIRNHKPSRRDHLGDLWSEGVWGKWIAAAYGLASAFVFVRDEFWRPEDESKWRIVNLIPPLSLAWWIVGALVILCVWIFEASFRARNSHQHPAPSAIPAMEIKGDANTASIGQSGGITANTVHMGRAPRLLTEETKAVLVEHVPKDKPVTINCKMLDGECRNYANQIRDFLVSKGFNAGGPVGDTVPVESGIRLFDDGNASRLVIGPDL